MCYDMQGKKELLHAINIFLDDVSDTVEHSPFKYCEQIQKVVLKVFRLSMHKSHILVFAVYKTNPS